jgi:hypothetical protein
MTTGPEEFSLSGKDASARSTIVWFAAALIGSAALGLLGGLIWGEIAPRAMLQEISTGTAELMNAETRAFIGADAWFAGIAAVAGLFTGVIGFRFGVSRRRGSGGRALVASGLILGGLAGAFVMLWLGQQIGLSGYNHNLASSPNGTVFPSSLTLGATSVLAFWPMLTAIVILISEWGTRPAAEPAAHGAVSPR